MKTEDRQGQSRALQKTGPRQREPKVKLIINFIENHRICDEKLEWYIR